MRRWHLWDDTTRHLWDDTIGTPRSTDKQPSGHHHYPSHATHVPRKGLPRVAAHRIGAQVHEGSELMVDVGVALAWVALSGASLKWLSVFGRTSAARYNAQPANLGDDDLMLDEIYPLESSPVGDCTWSGGYRHLPVVVAVERTPTHVAADVNLANA